MSANVPGPGPEAAVRWVDRAEPDALELLDPASGRATVVARPPEDLLPGEDLVALERLVFDWIDEDSRNEAEFELLPRVAADPLLVLNGLSWILGLWCVVRELRTGTSALDYARELDAAGPGDPEAAETWRSRVEVARLGVLAALTLDDVAIRVYRKAATAPGNDASEGTGPTLAWVTLILMRHLRAEMAADGLDTGGLVAAFIEHTVPATRSRRSFNPPR